MLEGPGVLKPKQVTYFLELPESREASLHFGELAEHYCEPARWIYTMGDIHYFPFQLRRLSYHFQG